MNVKSSIVRVRCYSINDIVGEFIAADIRYHEPMRPLDPEWVIKVIDSGEFTRFEIDFRMSTERIVGGVFYVTVGSLLAFGESQTETVSHLVDWVLNNSCNREEDKQDVQ